MCCKCCQYCLESCYWHLIEKRFCYDETIALYEDPEKEEKNNNMFDNMAFYDSVAIIAGRSVVTIDSLPDQDEPLERQPVIVQQPQPTKKLQWREERLAALKTEYFSKSVPLIFERTIPEEDLSKSDVTISGAKGPAETTERYVANAGEPPEEIPRPDGAATEQQRQQRRLTPSKSDHLLNPEVEARKRSLLERRMSKSLYLHIQQPKELPVIRQNSMPKFYLDTPQPHQTESSILPTISSALASPVPPATSGFVFDLQSVVQMERDKVRSLQELAQQQVSGVQGQQQQQQQRDERASKLLQIRSKIKLRRVKSSLATVFPHVHHI